MGNAFSELNDPVDQKERFQVQVDAKNAGNEEACDMDEDYIRHWSTACLQRRVRGSASIAW